MSLALACKEAFGRLHYQCFGRNGSHRGARILCYHDVRPKDAAGFAAHLDFLKTSYDVLPLSEYLQRLGQRSRRPAVAITFDDGYRDNYEIAFPLLRQAGLSAAFCIVSSVRAEAGAEREAAPEPPPGGWSPRLFTTWDELREMTRAGMEVAPHSHRHVNTTRLSVEELAADVRANCQALEQHLGLQPFAYAVPFGRPRDCHPGLPAILASHGIHYAMLATHGTNDGSVSPYALHRDAVQPFYSVPFLRAILSGCFDWTA